MKAFNAPHSVMLLEIDAVNMYDTAAENMGKVFISTELSADKDFTHVFSSSVIHINCINL